MSTYQPGEIVDVTIRGARIMEPRPGLDHILTLAYAQAEPGVWATISLTRPADDTVTIERVAPAEWPPQPGDLWRDRVGELWFVHHAPHQPKGPLWGRTTGGARWTDIAEWLAKDNGPLTLVHREPTGGAS